MARALVLVALVVALVACVNSQAILRAINGASKTLEWTSNAGGDLSFSHNTKNYLTFLTANSNNADFPQGVILGQSQADPAVPGSIRLNSKSGGSNDIEGFVRGRWLSLTTDDPKNLFVNGFEVSSVSRTGVTNNLAPTTDSLSYVTNVQIVPVSTTQNFALLWFQSAVAGGSISTYWYKCTLLDCSAINGPVVSIPLLSPTFLLNTANLGIAFGSAAGTQPAFLVSGAVLTSNTVASATLTTVSPVRTLNGGTGNFAIGPKGAASPLNIPSAIIGDVTHSVYYQTAAGGSMAFYGDSTTLFQCNGQLTIAAPTTFTPTLAIPSILIASGLVPFGTIEISYNGYIITGVGALAGTTFVSSTIFGGPAPATGIAAWVPDTAFLVTAGTITYGAGPTLASGATTFIVQWSGMQYAGGQTAFTGQVILASDGSFSIEISTASTTGATQISQGVKGSAASQRYINTLPAVSPQTNNCVRYFPAPFFVYTTCVAPYGTTSCQFLPFGFGYTPVTRHNDAFGGGGVPSSQISLTSLDVDNSIAVPTRFVYSGIVTPPGAALNSVNRQIAIWVFTKGTDSFFRPTALPITINVAGSAAELAPGTTLGGAVDFDAEFSSTGTWLAVVGTKALPVEQFNWAYRTLSFTTFPTNNAFDITSGTGARLLITSVDFDTNGESTPFGAAKIVRRGTLNYISLLIGKLNLAGNIDTRTAGTPIIFRSPTDDFKLLYAAFPSPYHAINAGAVTVWPHTQTDDVSVLSVPAWRGNNQANPTTPLIGDYPTLTRYTNGFLAPNAQGCNTTVAGKFYTVSSRSYACVELITQDAIWTRSGVYTWAPVGVNSLRRQFARPTTRVPCQ